MLSWRAPRGLAKPRLALTTHADCFTTSKRGQLAAVLRDSLPTVLAKKAQRYGWTIKQAVASRKREVTYEYKPAVYPGRITVLQTSTATETAWAALAMDGLDFHVIPGTHLNIFQEPRVKELADTLAACIEKAQKGEW